MAELVVSALTRRYAGVTAVEDVSFTVKEGEFLTLLGPSGCGKSTTLAAIAGLERPTSGRISLGGDVYFDGTAGIYLTPERRSCGLVFQSYALWPHMTVRGNCEFPLKLRKLGRRERQTQVDEALALVEMEHLADRYPHQLSGGQQQRVALARTLVFRPRILLLDEPLSNLDAKLRDRARTWLKHLQTKVGLTTVYVTHDQIEALAMSDRIAVMDGGHIVQLDTPRRIYRAPATPFVADFIGASNLIEARLTADASGVRAAFNDGQSLSLGDDAKGSPGESIMTAIRPESIQIVADGLSGGTGTGAGNGIANGMAASGSNLIRGQIIDQSYLGARFAYHVQTLGSTLRIESASELANGDVLLRVPSEGIVVFPPGGMPA
jgi:iron(III) transport system ATP-binding protein